MKVAVISDIHGNLPALEATLAVIDAAEIDEIWCLGDLVGYGAEPDACAQMVADRCTVSLVGNHDLAVLGEIDITTFSPPAAAAVRWTRVNVSEQTRSYLASLRPSASRCETGLFHASPRDPVWEYVLWPDQAAECLRSQSEQLSMVGHSHVALFFFLADGEGSSSGPPRTRSLPVQPQARGAQATAGTELVIDSGTWLVNPGSVGQPRDGDPRAAWIEFDPDARSVVYHRTEYDIQRAAEAIDEAGLPSHLGRRLYSGQ